GSSNGRSRSISPKEDRRREEPCTSSFFSSVAVDCGEACVCCRFFCVSGLEDGDRLLPSYSIVRPPDKGVLPLDHQYVSTKPCLSMLGRPGGRRHKSAGCPYVSAFSPNTCQESELCPFHPILR